MLSAVNMQKVADYFGVSVSYLLGNEETPTAEEGDGRSAEQRRAAQIIEGLSDDDLQQLLPILERYAKK